MYLKTLIALLFLCNSLHAFELAIVSMFRDEAPYLKEWIEYHKMVGVEHFWLYNDRSVDDYIEVLKPYMDEGIVEVIDWPTPPGTSSFIIHQVVIFRDAIEKAVNKAKWVAFVDIDEFILPLKNKTVSDCLNTHFSDADAVYVNWRNFGTNNLSIPLGQPIIPQLNAASMKSHPNNAVGKTIVRPECVNLPLVYYPHHFPLLSGYRYFNSDHEEVFLSEACLKTDGKHHDKYMRINHYALRDENYYQIRMERAKSGEYGNVALLIEYHEAFSLIKDNRIIDFIKKNYPEKYAEIWEMQL